MTEKHKCNLCGLTDGTIATCESRQYFTIAKRFLCDSVGSCPDQTPTIITIETEE